MLTKTRGRALNGRGHFSFLSTLPYVGLTRDVTIGANGHQLRTRFERTVAPCLTSDNRIAVCRFLDPTQQLIMTQDLVHSTAAQPERPVNSRKEKEAKQYWSLPMELLVPKLLIACALSLSVK